MPSSWLSSGAGAAQGLEELLMRQRQDEIVRNNMAQHQGQLAETVRSNQANEGLRQQQMTSAEADRGLAQQSLNLQREAQRQQMQAGQDDKMHDNLQQRADRTVPGSEMSWGEGQQYQKYGVLPMSAVSQSPGAPLPEGDQGPPLPILKFNGTQPQLSAQQNHADTVAQQGITNTRADQVHADAQANIEATRGATETQRGIQNEIARGTLQDRQARTADAQAKAANTAGEVKLGERGKRDLNSLDTASLLIKQVMPNFPPDIEDPNAQPDLMGNRINPKYNTVTNRLTNLADVAKYKAGFYDETSPMIQLEKLLQPVQAARYMAGSRNQKMMDLVLEHLGNPAHTQAEQYSRLKTLLQMTPALKQAIVDSERPVKVDSGGKVMERAGSSENPSGGTKVGRFIITQEP